MTDDDDEFSIQLALPFELDRFEARESTDIATFLQTWLHHINGPLLKRLCACMDPASADFVTTLTDMPDSEASYAAELREMPYDSSDSAVVRHRLLVRCTGISFQTNGLSWIKRASWDPIWFKVREVLFWPIPYTRATFDRRASMPVSRYQHDFRFAWSVHDEFDFEWRHVPRRPDTLRFEKLSMPRTSYGTFQHLMVSIQHVRNGRDGYWI